MKGAAALTLAAILAATTGCSRTFQFTKQDTMRTQGIVDRTPVVDG
jgi:hypothetical protein